MAGSQIDTAYHLHGGLSANEFEQLEFQHNVLAAVKGKLLPPKILSTLSASARIADIGTGTGIWLRDIASFLRDFHPNEVSETRASFVGIDIDVNKFPTPGALGSNIMLEEHLSAHRLTIRHNLCESPFCMPFSVVTRMGLIEQSSERFERLEIYLNQTVDIYLLDNDLVPILVITISIQ